ncbi:hypothetical protein K466DRAFT_474837, partial [Polyporus arcularius HHB13444]
GSKKWDLREYELDEEEWQIAAQLRTVLKLFSDATLFFSRSGNPNLVSIIPAMDHIDDRLAHMGLDEDMLPAVRAAASLGRKTCNRYYEKTDDTETNRIAMALHPSWKLDYFKEAGWENAWI